MMNPIKEEMKIEDVLEEYPQTAGVFTEFGLPCFVCGEPAWGTIGELASRYKVDVEKLLSALNRSAKEPSRDYKKF